MNRILLQGHFARRTEQPGFTLVELLVAMTVGLFLTGGIISLFLGSKQSYNTSDAIGAVQENGRFVIDTLTQELRQAGVLGCQRTLLLQKQKKSTDLMEEPLVLKNALNLINNPNPGPPNPPETEVYNWLFNFNDQAPLEGFDGQGAGTGFVTSLAPAGISITDLFQDLKLSDALKNSDIIVSRRASGNPTPVKTHALKGDPLIVFAQGNDLNEGDIALVSTCDRATVFQITDIQYNVPSNGENTISHDVLLSTHADFNAPGNKKSDLGFTYANSGTTQKSEAIGNVYNASTKFYYLQKNQEGIPALFVNTARFVKINNKTEFQAGEELADGVYGMQILYGSNDKAADCDNIGNDPEISNYQPANNVVNWSKINAVKLMLLIGSSQDNVVDKEMELNFPWVKPDGTQEEKFTATDRRFYQVFSTTVFLRNKLPCLEVYQW